MMQWNSSGRAPAAAAAALAILLAGCMVGPDFKPPQPPPVSSYTQAAPPARTEEAPVKAGTAQDLLPGEAIPAQWWNLFGSPALDRLVRLSLRENPTVASAQAALIQARENLRAQFGTSLLPQVDASFSAEREKFSGAAFGQSGGRSGSTFDLYNASVSVSYALDIFGGARRELESLRAQVDYQLYELEATYLTLTANVVTTAIQEVSLRAQLQATREILSEEEEQYKLVQQQFEAGAVSRSDVLTQETQLAQTRSTLPALEKSLLQARHQLTVLVGKFPSQAGALPAFDLESLTLPQQVPLSVPSLLTRQRPDVKAAEALLHAASAQVGVATANLYPAVTISGAVGSETTNFGDLLSNGTFIWNIAGRLLQPVFHGGALTARRRAAVAAYEQSAAQYRDTVLQAFRNVADALTALEMDARALRDQADAARAARASLDLAELQFRLGALSYISLLDSQRNYQQTRINLIKAQAARYADTAALFQALGGGWWNGAADVSK